MEDHFFDYVGSINKDSFDEETRVKAALAVRNLFLRLESPYERWVRMGWDETALDAALRVACDLKLWNYFSDDMKQPSPVDHLATATGSGIDVLMSTNRKDGKHLAAMGVLVESAKDSYLPTDFSASLKDPKRRQLYQHVYQHGVRALPEWLAKHQYQTPTDVLDCPWQLGMNTNLTFFEYFQAHPVMGERFNNIMQAAASEWRTPMDVYPIQERLIDGFADGVSMVDVGGGLGHDLQRIHDRNPVPDASYVLQDLPDVLAGAKVQSPIETMAHDFFTDQPVQSPRAFFMKQIMHDWPDEKAGQILAKLRPAMRPGYTKLLIHDTVIPATNARCSATACDLTMMSLFGSRERRQADWDALIDAAGLKLEQVWSPEGYEGSILEVVRAGEST